MVILHNASNKTSALASVDDGRARAEDCAMADDDFRVDLDDALAERVKRFAEAAGTPVATVIRHAVSDYIDDWAETIVRLSEFDRTGESLAAGPVLDRFEAAVAARVIHTS